MTKPRCEVAGCKGTGKTTWNICADGNKPRWLCHRCDLELNRMVCEWAFPKAIARRKIKRYEQREAS